VCAFIKLISSNFDTFQTPFQGLSLLLGPKFQSYRGNIAGFMGVWNISIFELISLIAMIKRCRPWWASKILGALLCPKFCQNGYLWKIGANFTWVKILNYRDYQYLTLFWSTLLEKTTGRILVVRIFDGRYFTKKLPGIFFGTEKVTQIFQRRKSYQYDKSAIKNLTNRKIDWKFFWALKNLPHLLQGWPEQRDCPLSVDSW